jgi:hypothetical protein
MKDHGTIDETVAISHILPRSFNALHPIRRHVYPTLTPVDVFQRTSTNFRPMLNAYNPDFWSVDEHQIASGDRSPISYK